MSTSTPEPTAATVKITGTGPNIVEGCKVYGPDGTIISDGSKCALCACGRTKNASKTCDGSHSRQE